MEGGPRAFKRPPYGCCPVGRSGRLGGVRIEVWAWAGWWLVALGWLISASLAAVECGWILIGARKAEEGEKQRSN